MRILLRRKGRRVFPKILLAVFLVLLIVIGLLFLRGNPFKIREIIVNTNFDINSNSKLTGLLKQIKNTNIFSINEETTAESIKKTDLRIREVRITKKIPDRLLIEIDKRETLAGIQLNNGFLLFDKEGIGFEEVKEKGDFPLIIANPGLQNLKVGSRIEDRQKVVFPILDFLRGKEKVENISFDSEKIDLVLEGGPEVLFVAEDEFPKKLTSLQTILNRFRIEGRRPVKIDMRFEKPVITF